MASNAKTSERPVISPDSALVGILALLIDEREERTGDQPTGVKTEMLLAQVGLSIDEIATVTGKKYDTVRMAISRGKKASHG